MNRVCKGVATEGQGVKDVMGLCLVGWGRGDQRGILCKPTILRSLHLEKTWLKMLALVNASSELLTRIRVSGYVYIQAGYLYGMTNQSLTNNAKGVYLTGPPDQMWEMMKRAVPH